MFFKSKLQKAIDNWIKRGGDLDTELRGLKVRAIKTVKDAKSVSLALQKILPNERCKESKLKSPLHSLVALFQEVQSRGAYEELIKSGLPELRRILQEGLECPQNQEYDLLMILKILGMYKQEEDAHRVVRTARDGLDSKSFWWSIVFRTFGKTHPYWKVVVDGLREPLPLDFIGVTYLDFVNQHARENDLQDHPFNTKEGTARLKGWLEDEKSEHFSYA